MKSLLIKQISQDYNINPKALKRFVKDSGLGMTPKK